MADDAQVRPAPGTARNAGPKRLHPRPDAARSNCALLLRTAQQQLAEHFREGKVRGRPAAESGHFAHPGPLQGCTPRFLVAGGPSRNGARAPLPGAPARRPARPVTNKSVRVLSSNLHSALCITTPSSPPLPHPPPPPPLLWNPIVARRLLRHAVGRRAVSVRSFPLSFLNLGCTGFHSTRLLAAACEPCRASAAPRILNPSAPCTSRALVSSQFRRARPRSTLLSNHDASSQLATAGT
ncbi:hypothetical protein BU26DRAFT_275749 [Trematosphaeria pertusa]|uniref:Uncharacterized protein n=1 Tax=Trematosphaeria pertusa TaxID=390896 RepID=A0A6A6IKC8_9PLEO|nr:uncharacterized protein BU26DRAFT_275749 [Trematosphaeria pertusa]KAF2251064.1 hypothetical protein BU26DRAFT_275749 [Trematosphaeria pertusa]